MQKIDVNVNVKEVSTNLSKFSKITDKLMFYPKKLDKDF